MSDETNDKEAKARERLERWQAVEDARNAELLEELRAAPAARELLRRDREASIAANEALAVAQNGIDARHAAWLDAIDRNTRALERIADAIERKAK